MRVREFALPQDYPAALDLWNRCAPFISLGRSDTLEEIRKKVARDRDLFLVAEEDSRLVGTVIGGFDGRRGLVYHLAVDPGCRSQGVGQALMGNLEMRLRARGCLKAYLLLLPDNPAVDFYRKRGWDIMPVTLMGKELT